MNLTEQINSHQYLYLDKLVETNDLELEIWIDEARIEGGETDIPETASSYGAIVANENCKKYKIKIEGYINYSVTNESFAQENENEIFVGSLFRTYTKSKYLDYVSEALNAGYAEDVYEKKYIHCEIVCLNHVIDIMCFADFEIEEITN